MTSLLITLDRAGERSLQEQIFERIREQIVSGRLAPGAPVPSSRALASELRVSRNSVIFAYERLINEGYLTTRPMVGTFVSQVLPDEAVSARPAPQPGTAGHSRPPAPQFTGRAHTILNSETIPIDFWPQRTDPAAFPVRTWRRIVQQALANPGSGLTEYGDPCGLMELRCAIADHVARARGVQARPEQIVIVAGAQLALNLTLRLLMREAGEIVVENPCNQGAAYLFERYNLRLRPVPVDARGLQTDRLEGERARLAYVTPSHQFPMGPTLALERRQALLRWAARNGAYVIEDDYDSEFRYDGALLPALKAMSPDNVIYLATFSKTLGAGLRIGYMIFPEHLAQAAATAKALLDNGHVWLEQVALARFIQSGGFVRHLRRMRQQYLARRDMLVTQLEQRFGRLPVMGAEAGTHVAVRFPERFGGAYSLCARARSRNIGLYTVQAGGGHEYPGVSYAAGWVLMGYASLTPLQVRVGVARLAQILGAGGAR